ncbi:peptide deformylase [Candidatus Shapirobacteria bacterium]|nr:peptide deformylase [Candidatus Shapirobacteria bacterium]
MIKVLTAPHPILAKKSKPVNDFGQKTKDFCRLLSETLLSCQNPSGIGLAAPQVGKNWQIFVIALPGEKPTIFINPKIISHSKEKAYFLLENGKSKNKEPFLEGCLSLPNIFGAVKRWPEIEVEYSRPDGKKQKARLKNLPAIVFQHEQDHLQGILFTQRIIKQRGEIFQDKNGQLEKI